MTGFEDGIARREMVRAVMDREMGEGAYVKSFDGSAIGVSAGQRERYERLVDNAIDAAKPYVAAWIDGARSAERGRCMALVIKAQVLHEDVHRNSDGMVRTVAGEIMKVCIGLARNISTGAHADE